MNDESNDIPNGVVDPDTDLDAQHEEPEDKPNPFLQNLRNNQFEQARSALVQTVVQRSGDTIGSIIDALESEATGDYIMFEIFRSMTIDEIVEAVTKSGDSPAPAPSPSPSRGQSKPVEEEDDLEDDNEFDDDGSLEAEEEEEEAPTPSPSRKKSSKKKKPPAKKKSTAKKKDSGALSKDYQKAILLCLKENKSYDEDSAMSASAIRAEIKGSDVDFRLNIGKLLELERVEKFGKARGTKYFRVRKKKG